MPQHRGGSGGEPPASRTGRDRGCLRQSLARPGRIQRSREKTVLAKRRGPYNPAVKSKFKDWNISLLLSRRIGLMFTLVY